MRKLKIFLVLFIVLVMSYISFSISKYEISSNGRISFSVATPILKLNILESNYSITSYSKTVEFTISNCNEDKFSDVELEYNIYIQIVPISALESINLYKVENDRLELIPMTNINEDTLKTIDSLNMKSDSVYTHTYILEIVINKNFVPDSINLNITALAEQS